MLFRYSTVVLTLGPRSPETPGDDASEKINPPGAPVSQVYQGIAQYQYAFAAYAHSIFEPQSCLGHFPLLSFETLSLVNNTGMEETIFSLHS